MTGRVALAVMAKVPAAGQVKTRLCPPLAPAEAAALDRLDQFGEVSDSDALVAFTPKEREAEMRDVLPTRSAGARRALHHRSRPGRCR